MPEPMILVDRWFFIRKVEPALEAMGLTARYSVTDSPRGHVVIHTVSETVKYPFPQKVRLDFIKILDRLAATSDDAGGKLPWHFAGEDDNLQWHEYGYGYGGIASVCCHEVTVAPPPQPDSKPLPPLERPVFDMTALREDLENDRRIREYSDHMIIVKSEHMVQTVKPGFAASGWIYAGNQYGDGTVGLQVVLAGDDKVVDPATVLKVLKSLHVPHRLHHRRPEPRDDRMMGGGEFDREDEDLGDEGSPPFLYPADAAIQEAAEAALKAMEAQAQLKATRKEQWAAPGLTPLQDPPASQYDATGALRVGEGEEMNIRGVYIESNDEAELRLEIGSNVITVVTSCEKATFFLTEAGALKGIIGRDRHRLR